MDPVNKRRCKIIKQKTGMIQRNIGFTTAFAARGITYITQALSGQVDAAEKELRTGPIIKFVTMRIPGTAFGSNGRLRISERPETRPSSMVLCSYSDLCECYQDG